MSAELSLGTPGSGELDKILSAQDIQPGDEPSYETCKRLYTHHPLGGKLAEKPVAMAMSQERVITIDGAPGDDVVEEFIKARRDLGLDAQCYRTAVISKVYGISAMYIGIPEAKPSEPLTPEDLRNPGLYVNAVDPLNTAGSLVLNQDPLSPDYLKPRELSVAGVVFHRSRSVVLLNEMPVYLEWVDSAFGFSGRSVFQRILYSLKTYIECMRATDVLAHKAAVIVAKTKQQSSAANQVAALVLGHKRREIKKSGNGNILSIGEDEDVYSLDLTNLAQSLDKAFEKCRETIAAGSGTPSILVNEETFAQGFSEGSEDSKFVADFIDHERKRIQPIMDFTDRIAMARAWTPDFYKLIQERYPAYREIPYNLAIAEWKRQFKAVWPSFLKENEGDKHDRMVKQLEYLLSVYVQVMPLMDPENQVTVTNWFVDCLNSLPDLVPSQLSIDSDDLKSHLERQAEKSEQSGDAGPFGSDPEIQGQIHSLVDTINRKKAR